MPRLYPQILQDIFALPARNANYLLDITFPLITSLRVATDTLKKSLLDYENDIEQVSEILRTRDTPINNVNITLQNKNYFYEQHYAANLTEWRMANAVLWRRYESPDGSLVSDREMFRGAIEKPQASDNSYTFSFQIIPDSVARGRIVAARSLAPSCQFVFKDPFTCAYTGPETVCDHTLKGDCTKYGNTPHYGGMQAFSNPAPTPPGAGGNPGTGGGGTVGTGGTGGTGGGTCFTGKTLFKLFGGEEIPFLELYKNRNYYTGKYAKSYDKENEAWAGRITKIMMHVAGEYLEVEFSDGTITEVTREHPFLTVAGEYVPIGKLIMGDRVRTDTQHETVKIVSIKRIEKETQVFNAEIAHYQNYIADGFRVHNLKRDPMYEEGLY